MQKNILPFLFLFFLNVIVPLNATTPILVSSTKNDSVIQQGITYLYNYKTKTKQVLDGVYICVKGAQPTTSDANGCFRLVFNGVKVGDRIINETMPLYKGLTVFNKFEVSDCWVVRKKPIRVIMCKFEEFQLAKESFRKQGEKAVRKRYEKQLAELKRIEKDKRNYADELRQKRQDAEMRMKQMLASLPYTSEEMALIDQSELDEEMRQVMRLYEDGEIDKAMEKLKGLRIAEKYAAMADQRDNTQESINILEDSIKQLKPIKESIDQYIINYQHSKE
jgi:hypothetical protein